MKLFLFGLLFVAVVVASAAADDSKEEALKKDRQRIEGTWRVVDLVVNGNPAKEEDAKKITVVNGSDGTWVIYSDGQEISKGTSTFDPMQKPKTIDFTITEGGGAGNEHRGIYELGDDVRKLCFVEAGAERPQAFTSEPNSGHILVKFERVKSR